VENRERSMGLRLASAPAAAAFSSRLLSGASISATACSLILSSSREIS
jgi:hypothetical protein